MAEVVLFHHVQGLTDGIVAFADRLRAGEQTVHAPDLFEGVRPATVEEGIAHVESVGEEELDRRVEAVVAELPRSLVYAGFSWGGGHAQRLAQTRPGARGALLYESFVSLTAEWSFGPWPDGLPVQIHGMDQDPFFALEGDLDAARDLVSSAGPSLTELYVYPGDQHLFTDSSLPSYDRNATALVIERSLAFLDRLG